MRSQAETGSDTRSHFILQMLQRSDMMGGRVPAFLRLWMDEHDHAQLALNVTALTTFFGPEPEYSIELRSSGELVNQLIKDENVDFDQKPDHGDLTAWADQGVLMLNAVLTGKNNLFKNYCTIFYVLLKLYLKTFLRA